MLAPCRQYTTQRGSTASHRAWYHPPCRSMICSSSSTCYQLTAQRPHPSSPAPPHARAVGSSGTVSTRDPPLRAQCPPDRRLRPRHVVDNPPRFSIVWLSKTATTPPADCKGPRPSPACGREKSCQRPFFSPASCAPASTVHAYSAYRGGSCKRSTYSRSMNSESEYRIPIHSFMRDSFD